MYTCWVLPISVESKFKRKEKGCVFFSLKFLSQPIFFLLQSKPKRQDIPLFFFLSRSKGIFSFCMCMRLCQSVSEKVILILSIRFYCCSAEKVVLF